ncbi:MAG: DUF2158 domain-containing protein [Pseudomonadota bacterium]
MAIFKIGDEVQLISGGPKMTVNAVKETPIGIFYECIWYDKFGRLEKNDFDENVLKQYPKHHGPVVNIGIMKR